MLDRREKWNAGPQDQHYEHWEDQENAHDRERDEVAVDGEADARALRGAKVPCGGGSDADI